MAIAISLQDYLDEQEIDYDVLRHKTTHSSSATARASHVHGDSLAKSVVLKWKGGYLLAIVPASRQVALRKMGTWLGQPVSLASEEEASQLFEDCDVGAVPPVGAAYGVRTVVDRELLQHKDIYFEGGDHRTLVHLTGEGFGMLMKKSPHRNISRPPRLADSDDTRFVAGYWGA